jgi:putative ABC transport system permease protein
MESRRAEPGRGNAEGMMNIGDVKESATMALDTIWTNKIRSGLTILGVLVGVVTVMFMVSIIQGLNRSFAQQIESLGSNTLFISKFQPSFGRPPNQEERQRKDLTLKDAEAIRREVGSLVGVSPMTQKMGETIRYQEQQSDASQLYGVTPDYELVQSQYVGEGRFITESDIRERSDVVVLGQDVVRTLFPNGEEALDKDIKIGGYPFRVVGIMEPLGTFFGQSRDNIVIIPLTTFQKYYRETNRMGNLMIIVRPTNRESVQRVTDDITDLLRRRRQVKFGEPNNFGISSQDSLLDIYNQLTSATYLVLTAISAVALMIGGIGVMNIMLVSVTERTKEIGIRKAVGATEKDILTQFLIEAMVLTGIGGVIGLIIGEAASFLMNRYSPLPAYVPWWAVAVGLGVSFAVGIIFGLYPAWKAARLNPIDALSFE